MKCAVFDCSLHGNFRCSRCHNTFYCSQQHQKVHWKIHKEQCRPDKDTLKNDQIHRDTDSEKRTRTEKENNTIESEKRMCRCMFCGENLLLSSEEEAIAHMGNCPALQEQLQSNEQITVPSIVKEKMKLG